MSSPVARVGLAITLVAAVAVDGVTVSVAVDTSASSASSAATAASTTLPLPAQLDRLAEESVRRWRSSKHGGMLVRILPRHLRPSTLPDAMSEGARLTGLYCVQCHYLPNPAMHEAADWERIVSRMLPRMRGEGNMGKLMAAMMLGPSAGPNPRPLAAPSPDEAHAIVDYLRRNAMRSIGDGASPELRRDLTSDGGRMFAQACGQCHALPDPAQHSDAEWPAVLRRMQEHMQWMNRTVGTRPDPREPELVPEAILGFLLRNAPAVKAPGKL